MREGDALSFRGNVRKAVGGIHTRDTLYACCLRNVLIPHNREEVCYLDKGCNPRPGGGEEAGFLTR